MIFWKLLLISYFVCGLHSQEIQSIGQFRNNDYTWATGIPVLEFSSSYDCSGLSFCQVNWWWGATRVANAILSTSTCSPLVNYTSIVCSISGGVLYSNISISNQFATPGNTSLQIIIGGASSTNTEYVNIQDCDSSSVVVGNGIIQEGAICDYLCNATVVCAGSLANSSAICQYDSTWLQYDMCLPEPTSASETSSVPTSKESFTDLNTATDGNFNETINCYQYNIAGGILIGVQVFVVAGYVVLICSIKFDKATETTKGKVFVYGFLCCAAAGVSCSIVLFVHASIVVDVCWSGGDIAAITVGYIGLSVSIGFCGRLLWLCKSKGDSKKPEEKDGNL